MDIHKLLKRQLVKHNIMYERKPENEKDWLAFIESVNNAYIEADQERYMHERSMDISSREMMNLNARLETAQHIARLGYWSYNGVTDYTIWSKELFVLFNLNPVSKPPNYNEFMSLVYENDRYELEQKINRAFNERVNYECEMRVRNPDGNYRWYKTIGQCAAGEKQLEGIIIDIHKNKTAEEKIKELNQQIVSAARRAGMAEVATTILHNIGNVLNSSNISVTLLKNNLNHNYQKKFFKTLEMLKQHEENLSDFLVNDSKGKIIPHYLLALSKFLLEESIKNNIEIDNLINDLKHINQIVDMQKTISGISSMNEKVYLPEIIETALNMSISSSSKNEHIKITKEFETCPLIHIDKSKLLQILVNVIQNARDSVLQNLSSVIKEIKLIITKIDEKSIQIIIEDNGVGIDPKNLHRIFAFGFTTKVTGHGFGLHSSALFAKEMGGSLFAESRGEGFGAQFILTLPIKNKSNFKGVVNE